MPAASCCINNSLILQKVLKYSDLLANLQFRLVDKRFNREILHRIRISHRKINIYVVFSSLPKITVNGSFVNPRGCFKFLIKTAGVRVQEFELIPDKKLWVWIPNVLHCRSRADNLHRTIMNVLLKDQNLNVFKGMYELEFSGCDRCSKHAMQSREYGPVQCEFLRQTIQEPKHFDCLIVDDDIMCFVADNFHFETRPTNRKEAIKKLAERINSNISCDHLQLPLYNHPDFFEDDHRTRVEGILPREVLEEMCMKWRPKSVGLSVISLLIDRFSEAVWVEENQFLTEFRFYDPYESTRVSRGFLLDHVSVDMDYAPLRGIFREDSSFFDDNLIANVRKVFPARHYFFNLHRMSTCHQLDQCRFEQLIRAVIRGTNQSNTSPVDITDKPFDMPETLSIEERVFTCSVSRNSIEDEFRTTGRVAKSFKISDKSTGVKVNLEMYVDKKQLLEEAKHVDSGFLKHYID